MAKKDKGTLYKEKMFQFINERDQMSVKDYMALPAGLRLLTKKQVIRRARTKRQRNARKIRRINSK